MRRSSGVEVVQRLNAAYGLLQTQASARLVVQRLMSRYGLSRRQAYRYLQQAREAPAPWPAPPAQETFSVKLPRRLVTQVRRQAHREGCALKVWVNQALTHALPAGEDYG